MNLTSFDHFFVFFQYDQVNFCHLYQKHLQFCKAVLLLVIITNVFMPNAISTLYWMFNFPTIYGADWIITGKC